MIDGAVEWNDKLKALANEMMETFQKQGLTCDEVSVIMMNVSMRVSDAKKRQRVRHCSRANLFEFFQRNGNAIDTHAIIRIDSGCKKAFSIAEGRYSISLSSCSTWIRAHCMDKS